MFKDFRAFMLRGNVLELAVGIIIGAAFTGVVNSLVNDIIMPPIGWLLGGVDFTNLYINLSDAEYASLAEAQAAGAATINYGLFLNAVINFLIVGLAVFLLVRFITRLVEHFERQEEEAAPAPAVPTTEEKLLATLDKLDETLNRKL
ncbi:MAG: large-conductance mechanosensitive channel protein MscL [Anaerolineae bacterium]|nr:large-conductance mechanosensitive channel protein MscL [Anaerolineae bacterium]